MQLKLTSLPTFKAFSYNNFALLSLRCRCSTSHNVFSCDTKNLLNFSLRFTLPFFVSHGMYVYVCMSMSMCVQCTRVSPMKRINHSEKCLRLESIILTWFITNLPIYRPVVQRGNAKTPFGQHVPLHFVAHQNRNTDAATYLAARDYCQRPSVLYLKHRKGFIYLIIKWNIFRWI